MDKHHFIHGWWRQGAASGVYCKPAKEKILSDGALVAGIASTTLASFDNVGYVCCWDSHQDRILSGDTDRHRNCCISWNLVGVDCTCFRRTSCLAFFQGCNSVSSVAVLGSSLCVTLQDHLEHTAESPLTANQQLSCLVQTDTPALSSGCTEMDQALYNVQFDNRQSFVQCLTLLSNNC